MKGSKQKESTYIYTAGRFWDLPAVNINRFHTYCPKPILISAFFFCDRPYLWIEPYRKKKPYIAVM
jgi:hypothetical protein